MLSMSGCVATLLFPEELARLTGCLYDIEKRLAFAFEVKRTTAVPETGIVGDEVVAAFVARWCLLARFGIHGLKIAPLISLCSKRQIGQLSHHRPANINDA